jgi:hypothetical protein
MTFQKAEKWGHWVGMIGDACGCNQKLMAFQIDGDRIDLENAAIVTTRNHDPEFIAMAEQLVMGPYIK